MYLYESIAPAGTVNWCDESGKGIGLVWQYAFGCWKGVRQDTGKEFDESNTSISSVVNRGNARRRLSNSLSKQYTLIRGERVRFRKDDKPGLLKF
jgi:hypothetical protein